jgi:hypothetical protein
MLDTATSFYDGPEKGSFAEAFESPTEALKTETET